MRYEKKRNVKERDRKRKRERASRLYYRAQVYKIYHKLKKENPFYYIVK